MKKEGTKRKENHQVKTERSKQKQNQVRKLKKDGEGDKEIGERTK